ncbi:helix-turn-helix domain-containing protein [Pleionea litopenaei]|uniref:Helix-turn-helix transcriptional regulator n=1 Tax=Pleionea litopenaei TaxID=3070815 RepID=A0AA51X8U8_9GAMM|nr:helix-turn-helix transcriptional regulator [Pleionea sp. HL-JVS1]WMS89298.1 helix-turn-helix transcriptional regulator [Pleionea sp. HL-JVS1]WMS89319.1 helix-turn-helix transcriptional regulator [Pleionea sp. HL-JVS1]
MIKLYESPFHATEEEEVASNLALRADLMILIRNIIEKNGWSQSEAANKLGVSQPRISNILNGKIDVVSLDCLFSILDKLGFKSRLKMNDDQNPPAINILQVAS